MNRHLKSVVTASLTAGGVLFFCVAVVAPRLPEVVGRADAQFKKTFEWPAVRLLRIRNRNGIVRVSTHDEPGMKAVASVRLYAVGDAEAEAVGAYADTLLVVEQAEDGSVLEVVSEPLERPDAVDVFVDYGVYVPVGTDLRIENENGNVTVYEGCGRVEVRGGNMDLTVHHPQGKVVAESLNGRIRVFDAADGADLKTVNGNIYANMLKGALRADTTNGVVSVRVMRPDAERCHAKTQNGDIRLYLCEGYSTSLDAKTEYGTVRANVAIDTSAGVKRRRQLRGAVLDGRGSVTMSTLNGDIWISGSKS